MVIIGLKGTIGDHTLGPQTYIYIYIYTSPNTSSSPYIYIYIYIKNQKSELAREMDLL